MNITAKNSIHRIYNSMISNIQNLQRTNTNYFITQKNRSNLPNLSQKADTVSFSGNIVNTIYQTHDPKEIKELTKLFVNSLKQSIYGKMPEESKFWIVNKYHNYIEKLTAFPLQWTAKQPDSYTQIMRGSDNKLLGGYSVFHDLSKNCVHVNFLTIRPELKNTKSSREILIKMAKNIYEYAKDKNAICISGTVALENKSMMKLIRRFAVVETGKCLDNIEYSISLNSFKKLLDTVEDKSQSF